MKVINIMGLRNDLFWAKKRGVCSTDVISIFATRCNLQELKTAIVKEIFRVSDPRGISDSYEDWLRLVEKEVEEVIAL